MRKQGSLRNLIFFFKYVCKYALGNNIASLLHSTCRTSSWAVLHFEKEHWHTQILKATPSDLEAHKFHPRYVGRRLLVAEKKAMCSKLPML